MTAEFLMNFSHLDNQVFKAYGFCSFNWICGTGFSLLAGFSDLWDKLMCKNQNVLAVRLLQNHFRIPATELHFKDLGNGKQTGKKLAKQSK